MAGPTAAESLIKAAAAGEGARKGGGAKRKGWKEVGGSTGPRPLAQSRYARRTREPGPPRVRDQESRVDPGPGQLVSSSLGLLPLGEKERAKAPRAERSF